MSDVYYKIYLFNEMLTVVCMQWFDEVDYDQDKFFTDEYGYALEFETEEEAERWLNENIKPEMIDPDHRKAKLNREDYFK
ncbi:hypothetical protein [Bacillus stercoris]|uniref:hypothetical protein n=1 Tax=Bacillus stercoris TaxID=2054641 RepID=UPI003CEAAF99